MRSSILTLNTPLIYLTHRDTFYNTLSVKKLTKYQKRLKNIFQYRNIKEMNISASVPSETDNNIDCLNTRDILTTSSR